MKKINRIKTAQMIIYIILTITCIIMVAGNSETRNLVAKNPYLLTICSIFWLMVVINFLFLFLDFYHFANLHKSMRRLNKAAYADSITGIPNRFSCDSLIEKYIGKPLPANIGCIMLDITNLIEINQELGRENGDAAIRQFSDILHLLSAGVCFVGRNGGNKFIALFENSTLEQLIEFSERLDEEMAIQNDITNLVPVKYQYGIAYHGEDDSRAVSITDLIAQANKKIYN
ncbi:MAG: diguanylate cyclase [Lachnospiraceae bacterium]|nr:diguanylate cyclase [Lachnospiraceae bacterium]MDD3615320.1 diguanylate cyclase [Lachnospiraceae bacterium]